MLQYVNGFSGICNEENNNLILKFVQNEPSVSEKEGEVKFEMHDVASLVMDYDCAIELVKYLATVLADKIDLEESSDEEVDE